MLQRLEGSWERLRKVSSCSLGTLSGHLAQKSPSWPHEVSLGQLVSFLSSPHFPHWCRINPKDSGGFFHSSFCWFNWHFLSPFLSPLATVMREGNVILGAIVEFTWWRLGFCLPEHFDKPLRL